MSNTQSNNDKDGGGVEREDIRMKEGEDGPILDVDGLEIHLEVNALTEKDIDSRADSVTTQLDSNADFSWWIIYPDDDLDNYVEVTPSVSEQHG